MWHLADATCNKDKNMRTALHLQTRFVGSHLIPGMAVNLMSWMKRNCPRTASWCQTPLECFTKENSRVHTGGSSKAGAAYKSCLISSPNEVRLSSCGKVRQRENCSNRLHCQTPEGHREQQLAPTVQVFLLTNISELLVTHTNHDCLSKEKDLPSKSQH